MAVNVAWARTGLTGGTSTDLDGIGVAGLTDDDIAFVNFDDASYRYEYDSASTAAEDSPNVIKPDDAGATGRWLLRKSIGTFGKNELINPNFSIDQTLNIGVSTSATNYYVDGWFNPSGGAAGLIDSNGSNQTLLGTSHVAQLYARRVYDGSNQTSGIIDGETLTVSAEVVSGTVAVSTGYGSGSGSALTLVSIGNLTSTVKSITFNADFGASTTNKLAIDISGSGAILKWIKVERGSSKTDYQEPTFIENLRDCEYFCKKSYYYGTALGTVTNAGSITFRNNSGGALATFTGIPSKVSNMNTGPSVTFYSPATGTSGVIRDDTTAADVAVIGTTGNGKNAFSTITLAATIPNNAAASFQYLYEARY